MVSFLSSENFLLYGMQDYTQHYSTKIIVLNPACYNLNNGGCTKVITQEQISLFVETYIATYSSFNKI